MRKFLFDSARCLLLGLLGCCGVYVLAVWCFAQLITPEAANGHLIRNADGEVVGSRLLAQEFKSERYFHGRPLQASASGLDPHITREDARSQVPRVAAARKIPAAELERALDVRGRLINVLELNLELDARK